MSAHASTDVDERFGDVERTPLPSAAASGAAYSPVTFKTASTAMSEQDTSGSLIVVPLAAGEELEALAFLAERPLHTVIMSGFIRDNGLISPLHRGVFYACRNASGRIEGIALIGHLVLVEARSDAVLAMFAQVARSCPTAHTMVGEQATIERFWVHVIGFGVTPRLICREYLFERHDPPAATETIAGLRLATSADLDLIIPVHAAMAFDESGVNPLKADPAGFRQRCAQRIEKGRVWVWTEGDRLIFKADVIADTPEVSYLEGIYVSPEDRGKGLGLRCLSQLTRDLLRRTKCVCLLANERHQTAIRVYQRAGFRRLDCYDTVFWPRQSIERS